MCSILAIVVAIPLAYAVRSHSGTRIITAGTFMRLQREVQLLALGDGRAHGRLRP